VEFGSARRAGNRIAAMPIAAVIACHDVVMLRNSAATAEILDSWAMNWTPYSSRHPVPAIRKKNTPP
jgi:hypothetical protein